jgi:hypothetical protein
MSDKVIDINSVKEAVGDKKENIQKVHAYTIAFYMELRVNLPMQPPKTLMVPDSMEIIFLNRINSPSIVIDTIVKAKEDEFFKRKLSSPDFGERRILSIKLFNIFYRGEVEMEQKEEPIN